MVTKAKKDDSYSAFLHTPCYAIYFQIGGIEKFMTRLIVQHEREYRENKNVPYYLEGYFVLCSDADIPPAATANLFA